jgi:hypothetical protein
MERLIFTDIIFLAISQMAGEAVPRIINICANIAETHALTCLATPLRYPHSQISHGRFAERDGRQDQTGLDAEVATELRISGRFDPGFQRR